MNSKHTALYLVVCLLCAGAGFTAGFQLHEPRVITQTETETEIKTVEVPKIVEKTNTKVETVETTKTKIVRDEVYVSDGLGENINKADKALVICTTRTTWNEETEDYEEQDVGLAINPNDTLKADYDKNSDQVVYTIDTEIADNYTEDEFKFSKSEFNRLVEEKCGVTPEENSDIVDNIYNEEEE